MNAKSSVYPAVVVASLLFLVGLLLVWLRFSVSIELIKPDSSLPKAMPPMSQSPSAEPLPTLASAPTRASKQSEPLAQAPLPESSPELGRVAASQGAFRMSNQTDQPVRVALLARHTGTEAGGQSTDGNPVHWDFAPGEGSTKGLILSLPESNLKLKKGDILVAFAQDGSRRYWGPYVVGETASPVWNRQAVEWQLILQP